MEERLIRVHRNILGKVGENIFDKFSREKEELRDKREVNQENNG